MQLVQHPLYLEQQHKQDFERLQKDQQYQMNQKCAYNYPQQPHNNPPQYCNQQHIHPPMQNMPVMIDPQYIPKVKIINQVYPQSANGQISPITIQCPSCKKIGVTNQTCHTGSGTFLWCFILFFTTGCCCIPFCVSNCKDKYHYCSNCGSPVGTYEYKICG